MYIPGIVAEFARSMVLHCPYTVPANMPQVLQQLYDELYKNCHRVDLDNLLNDFIIKNCGDWPFALINMHSGGNDGPPSIGEEIIGNFEKHHEL